MKKIIFGIFAHPDDETFGPCGTLLRETRSGTELHLVTLTNGDGGTNPDNLENLGDVRLREWRTAGTLLGATTMHHFGYQDGKLNNEAMIEVSQRLTDLVTSAIKNESNDIVIEFMTLDLNGLTGHIDHIVAARAACLAFYRLKEHDSRFTRIRFSCMSAEVVPEANVSWLYMEAGHSTEEIDETIDARDLREDVLTIMHTHYSQRNDCEAAIKSQGGNLGLNYFIVKD